MGAFKFSKVQKNAGQWSLGTRLVQATLSVLDSCDNLYTTESVGDFQLKLVNLLYLSPHLNRRTCTRARYTQSYCMHPQLHIQS